MQRPGVNRLTATTKLPRYSLRWLEAPRGLQPEALVFAHILVQDFPQDFPQENSHFGAKSRKQRIGSFGLLDLWF
jgi:hypothetical protein